MLPPPMKARDSEGVAEDIKEEVIKIAASGVAQNGKIKAAPMRARTTAPQSVAEQAHKPWVDGKSLRKLVDEALSLSYINGLRFEKSVDFAQTKAWQVVCQADDGPKTD
jgi:hypothetical protein